MRPSQAASANKRVGFILANYRSGRVREGKQWEAIGVVILGLSFAASSLPDERTVATSLKRTKLPSAKCRNSLRKVQFSPGSTSGALTERDPAKTSHPRANLAVPERFATSGETGPQPRSVSLSTSRVRG